MYLRQIGEQTLDNETLDNEDIRTLTWKYNNDNKEEDLPGTSEKRINDIEDTMNDIRENIAFMLGVDNYVFFFLTIGGICNLLLFEKLTITVFESTNKLNNNIINKFIERCYPNKQKYAQPLSKLPEIVFEIHKEADEKLYYIDGVKANDIVTIILLHLISYKFQSSHTLPQPQTHKYTRTSPSQTDTSKTRTSSSQTDTSKTRTSSSQTDTSKTGISSSTHASNTIELEPSPFIEPLVKEFSIDVLTYMNEKVAKESMGKNEYDIIRDLNKVFDIHEALNHVPPVMRMTKLTTAEYGPLLQDMKNEDIMILLKKYQVYNFCNADGRGVYSTFAEFIFVQTMNIFLLGKICIEHNEYSDIYSELFSNSTLRKKLNGIDIALDLLNQYYNFKNIYRHLVYYYISFKSDVAVMNYNNNSEFLTLFTPFITVQSKLTKTQNFIIFDEKKSYMNYI